MRNFDKYAKAGAEKIRNNSRYDMQLSDYNTLTEKLNNGEASIFEVLNEAFNAGVEAGARIQAKAAAKV